MIKLTIGDLVNSTEALQKLADKQLKAKLAWQVARLLKMIDAELQSFNDTRMNLVKKYGEKDETGSLITDDKGNCKILPDLVNEFSKELKELVDTEIELNSNKLKIEDLENLNFSPAEMNTLEAFIDFDEE